MGGEECSEWKEECGARMRMDRRDRRKHGGRENTEDSRERLCREGESTETGQTVCNEKKVFGRESREGDLWWLSEREEVELQNIHHFHSYFGREGRGGERKGGAGRAR